MKASDDNGTVELRDDVVTYVRTQVALGARPCAVIVEETVEYLDDEGDEDIVRALAWEAVGSEFAAHAAAQAGWPEVTDRDRLTLAFRALDVAGIVAREDFTCCQNCGLTEIGAEVADDETPRGYAFYHHQDAERAAEGGGLWISYGPFNQPPSAKIGEEVAKVLREHGLTVDWNGEVATRILVPLTWQCRRTGRLAAVPPIVEHDRDVDIEVLGDWTGMYAPDEGPIALARLTSLYLPWLPKGIGVRVFADHLAPVIIRREFDTLVGSYGTPDRPDLRVGRHDGIALLRQPPGADPTATPATEPGLLDVTYEHAGHGHDEPFGVPLGVRETIDVIRRMPARTDSWVSCAGRSGGVVQMRWEQGELWLETTDVQSNASVGRYATLAEAERMVTVLATEDRVAVRELGNLETIGWGD